MNKILNLNIKVVNNSLSDSDNNTNQVYKIKLNNSGGNVEKVEKTADKELVCNYKINDKVKHVEEDLTGVVKFIGSNNVSVLWNDGSRERIAFKDLNQLAYVDDVEEIVSPLSTQMNETEKLVSKDIILDEEVRNIKPDSSKIVKPEQEKSELDKLFESAFDEMEDSYDDIEDANPNKAELENQKLQRKINNLEKKMTNDKINNIKDNAIKEIISLMKDKGMIVNSESEKIQKDNLLKMDDTAFNAFKQAILSTGKSNKKSTQMTEAEMALERIKSGGPVIGDFSSQISSSNIGSSSGANLGAAESRNLQTMASSSSVPNTTSENNHELNFDVFKNLEGITKPIQVIAEQKTPSQGITDAIASMDWTTITKVF